MGPGAARASGKTRILLLVHRPRDGTALASSKKTKNPVRFDLPRITAVRAGAAACRGECPGRCPFPLVIPTHQRPAPLGPSRRIRPGIPCGPGAASVHSWAHFRIRLARPGGGAPHPAARSHRGAVRPAPSGAAIRLRPTAAFLRTHSRNPMMRADRRVARLWDRTPPAVGRTEFAVPPLPGPVTRAWTRLRPEMDASLWRRPPADTRPQGAVPRLAAHPVCSGPARGRPASVPPGAVTWAHARPETDASLWRRLPADTRPQGAVPRLAAHPVCPGAIRDRPGNLPGGGVTACRGSPGTVGTLAIGSARSTGQALPGRGRPLEGGPVTSRRSFRPGAVSRRSGTRSGAPRRSALPAGPAAGAGMRRLGLCGAP